jgi:hypothetical protein
MSGVVEEGAERMEETGNCCVNEKVGFVSKREQRRNKYEPSQLRAQFKLKR